MTRAILLPAQLLDRLAIFTAFLLGRVAIPITSAKLALPVVAPASIVTSIVTAVITTTMISIVMVAATFIRRVVLVIVRILLLALALSFGAMIEHIIMICFVPLVALVIYVFAFLGRVSVAIANDWVHPEEFKL